MTEVLDCRERGPNLAGPRPRSPAAPAVLGQLAFDERRDEPDVVDQMDPFGRLGQCDPSGGRLAGVFLLLEVANDQETVWGEFDVCVKSVSQPRQAEADNHAPAISTLSISAFSTNSAMSSSSHLPTQRSLPRSSYWVPMSGGGAFVVSSVRKYRTPAYSRLASSSGTFALNLIYTHSQNAMWQMKY